MNCIAANSYHCLIKQHEIHIVPQGIEPQRLQEYGVGIFIAANTKSALKKAIKKNYISINGQNASTADFIRGGETIELYIPKESTQKKQLIFPIDVLFEDEYLAVIRKPAGILVSGNGFMTIANALVQNLKPSNQVDATKPQPVHRLDYATTGALLVGKTSSSIRALNKLFENGQVEKTYYAINIGTLEESGTISAPIDDKKAITHFQVVDTAVSERFTQLNLLKLNLETGAQASNQKAPLLHRKPHTRR